MDTDDNPNVIDIKIEPLSAGDYYTLTDQATGEVIKSFDFDASEPPPFTIVSVPSVAKTDKQRIVEQAEAIADFLCKRIDGKSRLDWLTEDPEDR